MPFKSQAQRRWMYKNLPEIAKRWEKETLDTKSLPSRVKAKFKNLMSNRTKGGL